MESFGVPPLHLSENVFVAAQGQPVNNRTSVYVLWSRIVEQYVLRQLSHWEDRLPALAGIAVPFQRILGAEDVYLAGMWLGDMPQCLAWRVGYEDDLEAEDINQLGSETAREPVSWSWVSLRSKVY